MIVNIVKKIDIKVHVYNVYICNFKFYDTQCLPRGNVTLDIGTCDTPSSDDACVHDVS